MSNRYSFFNFIKKYKIEIPDFQREYAQGRDNPQSTTVRKEIIKNFYSAVRNPKSTEVCLDFIYGRIHQDDVFIPFDGQQRLTTLYLFHVYILSRLSKTTELKRFLYKTRKSTEEFCKQLIEHSSEETVFSITTETPFSEYLRDQAWFLSRWNKDPTIKGMLNTLDEIHRQSKASDNFEEFERILLNEQSENCPIYFYFLDMDKQKLPDETYIKMNARGLPLTSFEIFKAFFEEFLKENNEQELLMRFIENIDTKWIDAIWRIVQQYKENDGQVLPDTVLLSIINRQLNNYRDWVSDKSTKADLPFFPSNDQFIDWSKYENILACAIEKNQNNFCIKALFNLFDYLSDEKTNIQEFFRCINSPWIWDKYNPVIYLSDQKIDSYSSRVIFFALLKYFEHSQSGINLHELRRWMRIVWNIVQNTVIDNYDRFNSSLKLFDHLSHGCREIYQYLCREDLSDESKTFKQLIEERKKAKIICANDTLETQILAAENYSFFEGSIDFMLPDSADNFDLNDFNYKFDEVKKIFTENKPNNKDKNDVIKAKSMVYLKNLFSNMTLSEFLSICNRALFNNKESSWKVILREDKIRKAVQITLFNNKAEPRPDIITELDQRYPFAKELVQNTNLLDNLKDPLTEARIKLFYDHVAFYPYYGHFGIFLERSVRNLFFNSFLANQNENTGFEIVGEIDTLEYKVNDKKIVIPFGFDIYFKIKGLQDYSFIWQRDETIAIQKNNETIKPIRVAELLSKKDSASDVLLNCPADTWESEKNIFKENLMQAIKTETGKKGAVPTT